MFDRLPYIMAMVLSIVAAAAHSQDKLPRVLIIGDRIYQQPCNELNKELKGKATVVYTRLDEGDVMDSGYALNQLDKFLGSQKWDLIHFNAGLGDLIYRHPDTKSFRILPPNAGGVRATDPAEYRMNLQRLATKLKAEGAILVWASTTPIRHSATGVFTKGSEIEYNRIAREVMTKNGILINDMHSHVKNLIDMNKPAAHGFDPFFFDRKPIHKPILKIIERALQLDE